MNYQLFFMSLAWIFLLLSLLRVFAIIFAHRTLQERMIIEAAKKNGNHILANAATKPFLVAIICSVFIITN